MKVPVSWLQDFVDLSDIPVPELAARLTESTAQVDNVATLYSALPAIVSAQITSIQPHPHSNKLSLCQICTGSQTYSVVCGAPALHKDSIVPFAAPGTILENGIEIQCREIAGVTSQGMLLSAQEVGIGDDHSGLMQLPGDTPLGTPLSTILQIQPETVFEIDNNSISNRPDLWGIYGMARECAALYHKPLKPLITSEDILSIDKLCHAQAPIALHVCTKLCRFYAGLCVDGVHIDQKSPLKIALRLRAVGLKPNNLLVDLSNYIMYETGLPNHFFDRDRIASTQIVVTTCTQSQTFVTLDNAEHTLAPQDIIITNGQIPLVIAGVMGGEASSIQRETNKIFIEGAVWDPQAIRQTSIRLGLRTDASIRYEKSLDIHSVLPMLYRCAQLLIHYFPQCHIMGPIQTSQKLTYTPQAISLPWKCVGSLLNLSLSTGQAEHILQSLGFQVSLQGDTLQVLPPSWRCSREPLIPEDIIEDIGRIAGYRHIKSQAPSWALLPKNLPPQVQLQRAVQDFLVFQGAALEVMTHPLIGNTLLAHTQWPAGNSELIVPQALSPDRQYVRSSLVPSFLEVIEKNQKLYEDFKFFEYGRVAQSITCEQTHVAFAQVARQSSPFVSVANILEDLLVYLHIGATLISDSAPNPLLPVDWPGAHPYEILHVQYQDKLIGYVVSLHPLLLKQRKIKGYVSLFELDVTPWLTQPRIANYRYTPLMRYQESVLDFTVIAKRDEEIGRIVACLHAPNPTHHIVSVKVKDVFVQDSTTKAVTVRIRLNCAERTLTHEDLKASEQFITQTLATHGWPLKV